MLAASDSSFVTFRWIEKIIGYFNTSFAFDRFNIELIATDLSSQFVNHLTTSIYIGLLCASPLIVTELFGFIFLALIENEKKYSVRITLSFRLLATYTVADKVHTKITLDDYISSFVSMALLIVFAIFQTSPPQPSNPQTPHY
ncbi:twin-arginine translocase subunit TatC [Bacteroides caecimuris]|uniref:twin-arginine translocase subunit TatC n=1 Tax=Bacteroides caecimuris TaxID=1796613 RepID=UPI0034A05BA4